MNQPTDITDKEVNLGARIAVLQLLARQDAGVWYPWSLLLAIEADNVRLSPTERDWTRLAMDELVKQGYAEARTIPHALGTIQDRRITDLGRRHLESLLADMASRGRFPRRMGLNGEEIA